MAKVAHHLRITGATGAHPDKDGLKNVTPRDGTASLAFLKHLLEHVYSIPADLDRMSAEKSSEAAKDPEAETPAA
jgi:hypothetical protein